MSEGEAVIIPFDKGKRDERLQGDIGDQFRTAEAQDIFRARWNDAQARLSK